MNNRFGKICQRYDIYQNERWRFNIRRRSCCTECVANKIIQLVHRIVFLQKSRLQLLLLVLTGRKSNGLNWLKSATVAFFPNFVEKVSPSVTFQTVFYFVTFPPNIDDAIWRSSSQRQNGVKNLTKVYCHLLLDATEKKTKLHFCLKHHAKSNKQRS